MALSDLDSNDILRIYWIGRRRRRWGQDAKGQEYSGWGCKRMSNLFQVLTLFSLGEGEEDLGEGWVKDTGGKLLQVAVEGVGDKEVEDWSW